MTQLLGDVPAWEFRLDAWDDGARAALADLLARNGIACRWEGAHCLVPQDRHHDVERIIQLLHAVPSSPPGWYPDPWALAPARWWDGRAWTGFVTEVEAPERSWIPARGSHEQAMPGGGIAFVGFLAAMGASLLAAWSVELLGGSVHSLEALCAAQAALWACLFASCKLAVRRHGGGSLRELGLERLSRRQVGAGLLIGLVTRFGAGALAVALTQLFSKEQLRSTAEPVVHLDRGVLEILVVTSILVVGAPFFEELFFRGLVQGALTNRFGARVAVFAQAACFGVVHFRVGMTAAEALITIVTIGVTGCVLGVTRWHYEKLGPGMVAHGMFNAFVVLVVVLA